MTLLNICLVSLFSLASMFVSVKIIGNRQMSELNMFDYINGITIGSIAAEMATELEKPYKPLIAMVVYGAISVMLSICSNKFMRVRKYINATPTILLDDGKIFRENLKKAKLDLSEFLLLCRQQGYYNLCDIQTAVFEFNGLLSVIPKSEKRPLTPEDMNLTPEKASIPTELIMDGIILSENLQRLGFDKKWLNKRLCERGFTEAKEVFFAFFDGNGEVFMYPMNVK